MPTLAVSGKYPVVAKGATAKLTGHGVAGAAVALYSGSHRLARVKASSKGVFSFARRLTATTTFTVVSDGKTSKALKVSVVALTLRVVGRQPLAAGKHVLQGQAPRGMTVTLQQNGRTIAHTTATKHNAFAFTRALTTTHKYRIACDGVVSRTITVHVR